MNRISLALLITATLVADPTLAAAQTTDLFVGCVYDNLRSIVRLHGDDGRLREVIHCTEGDCFDHAHSIAFDDEGQLLVGRGNFGAGSGISRHDIGTGAFLEEVGDAGFTHVMIKGPDGLLYFAKPDIERIDPTTGTDLGVFIARGTGGVDRVHDLAFGPDGNLYVASYVQGGPPGYWRTGNILKFDGTTGAFIEEFVPTPALPDTDSREFVGITFGPDGHLYAVAANSVNYDTNGVLRFDGTTGAPLGTFAQPQFLDRPHRLRFGPDGNLYVADWSRQVQRFAGGSGTSLGRFGNVEAATDRPLNTGCGAWGLGFQDFGGFDVPISNAGADQTVDEAALVTLDGSGSFDPNGGTLGYAWSQLSGTAVTLDLSDPARPSFTAPDVPSAGEVLTFQLIVNDGASDSGNDLVDVTVKDVNNPPIADLGPDQVVEEGSDVTLDATASYDPDVEPLTYAWLQTAGTSVVLFDDDTAQPTFTAPMGGTYPEDLDFEVTISDGIDAVVETTRVTITDANGVPVVDAGPDQTVAEGLRVTLDGSGSFDPDRDPLTYTWTETSATGVVLDETTPRHPAFIAPSGGLNGVDLTFELVVDDGVLASVADSVTVHVLGENQPPRCDLARARTEFYNRTNNRIRRNTVIEVRDDRDQRGLLYFSIDSITQDEPLLGVVDAVPNDARAGGYSLRLSTSGNGRIYGVSFTAIDLDGAQCAGAVSTCVKISRSGTCTDDGQIYDSLNGGLVSDNAAPVTDAGPDQLNAFVGQTVHLAGSAFDPESDPFSYEWLFTHVPEGSALRTSDLSDPTDPTATFVPDVEGTYVLALFADDTLDRSAPDAVAIVVPEPGTALGLASGAALLAALARRRGRSRSQHR